MAQAGHTGAVTVLTAEVARGCDVPPAPPAGVAVLAACHSRSARADQWLCGLAGRREEPGESQFFLSLEDPLLRGLRSRLYNAVPARFRRKADAMPLSASQARIVNELQRNAERASSQRRRACLELEAVEAAQRSQVYSLIEDLVRAPDLRGFVGTLIDEVARIYVRRYTDPDRLLSALSMLYHTHIAADDLTSGNPEQRISSDAHAAYARHEQFMGQAAMRQTERKVVFSMINRNWCQQLAELDAMRTAASLESGSLEHLAEYENEAAKRYAVMLEKVKVDIIGYLFHSEPPAG